MSTDRCSHERRGLPDRLSLAAGTILAVAAGIAPGAAQGAVVIGSSQFFDNIPTTLIDFQTDGSGAPIDLIPGESVVIPADEYLTSGVSFTNSVRWVNDGNAAFQAALTIGATPEIAIPSSDVDQFDLVFSVPVKAFGFFVVNNRLEDPAGPTFTAYNAQNQVLGTVQFAGDLIDGTITTPNTVADYGFMGLFTTEDIARVSVSKQSLGLDDLRFSPVPAPGAIVLSGLAGMLVVRRRRSV